MNKPYSIERRSAEEMLGRAEGFRDEFSRRRTVRDFSPEPVPERVIEACLEAANTAPNGANMQPWHFVVVTEAATKSTIQAAAEAEEREFYDNRATEEWLQALAPIGTDAEKPFLSVAPVLIAIFQKSRLGVDGGESQKTYYSKESTGIATGVLIAALHHAGLATLTHTPSPMRFLNQILERPESEKPFLLLVVGYPAEGCMVPDIERQSLAERVSRK